jgi:N-acetyl-anhydromuramyl-L-alanine amidase AmpD
MADTTLPIYSRSDDTAGTSADVCGVRHYSPRGSCIHTTSGTSSQEWLQGGSARAGSPASATALIDRDGTQHTLVDELHYAYHAGVSLLQLDRPYAGVEINQILLGFELECLDNQNPTFQQYDSLADLICYYAARYGWRWPFLIYGHYGIARPLGRRSDPVNFDWGELMGRLYVRALDAHIPGLL